MSKKYQPTVLHLDYCPSRNSFIVSFPFDSDAWVWIKDAPERRYLPTKRLWVLPATTSNLDYLHLGCDRYQPPVFDEALGMIVQPKCKLEMIWSEAARAAADKIEGEWAGSDTNIRPVDADAHIGSVYPDYTPKTAPRSYQVEAFTMARDRESFGIFFEQGLGKTKVAVDLCGYWLDHGIVDAVIVLCPNFVKGVWKIEVDKHAAVHLPFLTLSASDGKKRKARMMEAKRHPKCWIVTNYEELLTSYYDDLYWIACHKRMAIVADESTRIKNRAAQVTKNAVGLAHKCVKRLILTGTPMANNPLDFWAQFRFLNVDLGFKSFVAFRDYHAVMGGFAGRQTLQWLHLDELKERVAAHSLRRTKEECLDLPEKIYQVVHIEMPKEMRDAYECMRNNAFLDLSEHAAGTGKIESLAVITNLMRLSQICGGTLKMEDGHAERLKQQPKLDALMDVLDGIDPSHSVIIWARFVAELKMIAEALEKKGMTYSLNYGDTPVRERDENIAGFQNKRTRFFLGQPHAVGYGITLTAASYAVYYSNDYSYETRVQSEDRCHRIGTVGNVTYIDLVMEDSLDETLLDCLERKQDLARYVVETGIEVLKGSSAY